ncbi:MAG: hypothetical protein EBX40_04875 [Gammaproteobacteria bacterium]|nr:hypothetical protein [Gammaproteobacteria bacterium]
MADQEYFDELLYTPQETTFGLPAQIIAKNLPAVVNPYGSTGSNLAAVIGGGLLAGLLQYGARREAEAANRELVPRLLDVMTATNQEELKQRILTANDPKISKLATALSAKMQLDNIAAQRKLKEQQNQAIINVGEKLAIGTPGGILDFNAIGKPIISAPRVEETPTLKIKPVIPGEPTAEERFKDLLEQAERLGLEGKPAINYATTQLQSQKQLQSKLTDDVAKVREAIQSMDEIIATAESAIPRAGLTGNFIATTGGTITSAGADILQSFGMSPPDALREQQQKRAATKELQSITPKQVNAIKFPGALAVKEMDLLIGAGISDRNTPQQNIRLLQNMKVARKRMGEYTEFAQKAIDAGHSPAAIGAAWDEYTAINANSRRTFSRTSSS